jgi:hypothetical protein
MRDARRTATHREFLALAAERLEAPLKPPDEEWLEAHLATCEPCRDRAAGYAADRAALRRLRRLPAPPRDLWARTSAVLDREAERRSRAPRLLGLPVGGRTARAAFAAAVGLVLVVAATGSGLLPGFPGGPTAEPAATPLAVEPRVLAYISTRDGEVGVYMGRIARVCPEPASAQCLPLESDVTKVASFTDFVPQQLAVSPDGRAAAVVGTSRRGGAVYALRFPELDAATPSPAPASPGPTGPTPTEGATPPPDASPGVEPTAGPGPALIIDNVIVVGEPPAYSADGTMLAFSAMPADGSSGPDIYLWRAGEAAAVPLTGDHGSIFASWAGGDIVGSRVVPAGDDLVDGEDGDARATPVSFVLDLASGETRELARAAWRPIVDPTGRFVIYWDGTLRRAADGLTWEEASGGLYLADWATFDPPAEPPEGPTAPPSEQPTDEPTDQPTDQPTMAAGSPGPTRTVAGTPDPTEEGTPPPTPSAAPRPTEGATPEQPEEGTPEPTADASPEPTEEAGPRPPGPEQLVAGRDYAAEPIVSWEVRWSPDGQWYGVWIGEGEPGLPGGDKQPGTLTVGAVDRATGRIDPTRLELDSVPALRGFAMGDHRIAWATLPGDDGASEIRLLAWSETGRGEIRTKPGGGHNTLPAL